MSDMPLHALLETLQKYGVKNYETREIKLELMPKPFELPKELQAIVSAKLTDEEMLLDPMKGLMRESDTL